MSRLMLIGSLRAPVVHDDPVGLIQLHARAMQAADELERLWENNDRKFWPDGSEIKQPETTT